jgi:hypothetical protein
MTDQQTGSSRDHDGIEEQRLALEQDRLRFERKKVAMEFRLKRSELTARRGKEWKELVASPLTLAIVGGFITVMTTIISNHFNTTANLALEATKAELAAKGDAAKAEAAAQAAKQTLQADLIKKFVESPKTETVRENLRFLVDAGLLPDYASKIRSYLANNPNAAPQVGSTSEPPSPVVGGAASSRRDWPWLVGLTVQGANERAFLFCQGTLLGPRTVLTNAVCGAEAQRHSLVKVVTAKGNEQSQDYSKGIPVSKIYVHPSYSREKTENDIALLELKEPLPPPYVTISRARISDPAPNDLAVVAAITGTQFEFLEARLPIAADEECRKSYGDKVDPARNICAGFATGGADTCQGAGGGPLAAIDQSGRKYQVGITSWGEGCGKPGKYGVYTRISAFAEWIRQIVPELLPEPGMSTKP